MLVETLVLLIVIVPDAIRFPPIFALPPTPTPPDTTNAPVVGLMDETVALTEPNSIPKKDRVVSSTNVHVAPLSIDFIVPSVEYVSQYVPFHRMIDD
jgi:hypothetical protein